MSAPAAPVFIAVEPQTLGGHGDLLKRVFQTDIDGFVLRAALPESLCADVLLRCRALAPQRSPMFPGCYYGGILPVAERDLAEYLAGARALETVLDETGIFSSIVRLLGAVAQPMAIETPLLPDGRQLARASVRVLERGQGVSVHSERWEWESMAELRPLVDPSAHLSFYVPLALPERGGELVVYHPARVPPSFDGVPPERAHELLEPYGATVCTPAVGDLLLFDGGRFNHRVVPVNGALPRVTLGGFGAIGRDRERVLIWS